MSESSKSVIILGATGAVGGCALQALLQTGGLSKLTLLGRRPVAHVSQEMVSQHNIDIFDTTTYMAILSGHEIAICTLGVGQPSKVSRADFLKIDKQAVIDFAMACKQAGVAHFQLLSSVGASASSASFYLKTKGELIQALEALNFERLSIFQPSMILTPTNRYGFMQGLTLKVWPLLHPLLIGKLRKYRGVRVENLGKAMAYNSFIRKSGVEFLTWNDFQALVKVDK